VESTTAYDAERSFAATMRAERLAHGISQTALAADLSTYGVVLDGTAITKMEKGTRAIRLGEAVAICIALGISLEEMVSPEATLGRRVDILRGEIAGYEARMHDARDELSELESLLNRYRRGSQ
jgi:transcriptional regulator with XRE-family HTH domain